MDIVNHVWYTIPDYPGYEVRLSEDLTNSRFGHSRILNGILKDTYCHTPTKQVVEEWLSFTK